MAANQAARRVLRTAVAGLLLTAVAVSIDATSAQDKGKGKGAGGNDYSETQARLGIKKMRKGWSSQESDKASEDNANPHKDKIPDLMTFNDGTKVTKADQWPKRRAEIVELFEREVYGRVPKNVPKVTWKVTKSVEGESGGIATVTKTLEGTVDNSGYPQISVKIQASFTVPKYTNGKVPIIIQYGGVGGGGGKTTSAEGFEEISLFEDPEPQDQQKGDQKKDEPKKDGKDGKDGKAGKGGGKGGGAGSWSQQALNKGWGYGTINPGSIQADNGGGLRSGVVGLTNKGQPRQDDDWGALRAWGWGVSCLIDYFEANPDSGVDPTKVCITGVSRYGKAALVAGAFDTRVAASFVASSGAGGAKLWRHIFGELLENVAGSGEYHWMAANFLKYGADDATFGKKTVADLPVDQHQLIAMCAPRLCLVSTGSKPGDPNWIDVRGTFQATVLAGPAWTVLGKKDVAPKGTFMTEPLPGVNTFVGGELAWRQHSGGHDNTPNFPAFYEWAEKYIPSPGLAKKK